MMRAILAGLALLPFAALAEAPAAVGPGAFQLTGNTAIGFERSSTRVESSAAGVDVTTDFTELAVHAAGLYYAWRDVAVGVSAAYDRSRSEGGGVEEVSWTLTIGPTISAQRPIGERLALFARGTFGYATARSTATAEPEMKADGFGVSLLGGVRYFVVPQFSVDAGLSWTWTKLTTDAIETASGTIPEMVGTSSGLTVAAGLSVFFGR